MDGSIHIVYKDREALFTAIKELPSKRGYSSRGTKLSTKQEMGASSGPSLEKIQPPISTH